MGIRSLRGAIDVSENSRQAILQATEHMLDALIEANGIETEEVIAAFFSATADLDAVAPARAARDIGWDEAALHCYQEMQVEGSLPKCVRVTVLWETDKVQAEMVHCYLGKAAGLRPDLNSIDH